MSKQKHRPPRERLGLLLASLIAGLLFLTTSEAQELTCTFSVDPSSPEALSISVAATNLTGYVVKSSFIFNGLNKASPSETKYLFPPQSRIQSNVVTITREDDSWPSVAVIVLADSGSQKYLSCLSYVAPSDGGNLVAGSAVKAAHSSANVYDSEMPDLYSAVAGVILPVQFSQTSSPICNTVYQNISSLVQDFKLSNSLPPLLTNPIDDKLKKQINIRSIAQIKTAFDAYQVGIKEASDNGCLK